MLWTAIEAPIGSVWMAVDASGLRRVRSGDFERPDDGAPASEAAKRHLESAGRAFEAYFAGVPDAFDALELAPCGTDFQLRVWRALQQIPYGETRSYGELARSIGQPGASRAVGMANHRNPLGIVVPCHRVIAADGGLGGYAGGTRMKRWLLEHEGAFAPSLPGVSPA